MITSPNNHQKHAKLERPLSGEWGRNEFAILGTTCDNIKQLAYAIIQTLPQYKIAYVDADHKTAEAEQPSVSAISSGAHIEYTNKISYTQVNINTQPNSFYKKALFNECDLVLVNGNHFTASKQIVVIDEKKPLNRKLEKLTDVQGILKKSLSEELPFYLQDHLPDVAQLPQLLIDDTEAIVLFIKTHLQQRLALVNGLILSGGKSTRMGRDKGEIEYHNKTQRQHAFELLQCFCNNTFVSCNREQSASLVQTFPLIEDSFSGLGPMSGILSAFQRDPNKAWLVIACDLPFLTKETIAYLFHHRNPSKIATAFLDPEGKFPEPLITIWEPKAYPVLLRFLSEGYSCPRKALINSDIEIIQAPDVSAFKNVNTTEEYREVMEMLNKEHSS